MLVDSIEKSIVMMKERPGDEISINDLARAASLSKFHFCRLFRRVTGVTPGRFLSAVRLEEAKKLLLTTTYSVTEISYAVGYNSLGTFTSRFTYSVGLTPTEFRRQIAREHRRSRAAADHVSRPGRSTVRGHISSAVDFVGTIIVGLFTGPIAEGWPPYCTTLTATGAWRIDHVPAGEWYVAACGTPNDDLASPGTADRMLVARAEPITITEGLPVTTVDLILRPLQVIDPPVLVALSAVAAIPRPRTGD